MATTKDNSDEYRRERDEAEEDATAIAERTNDLPPRDLFHAARDLFALMESDSEARAQIGTPDDPALWGMLDVTRASAWARQNVPAGFDDAAERHSWLRAAAETASPDALGAMEDAF